MNSGKTKALVQYGILIAFIFVLGLTTIGYIPLPIAAITIVHIPVIIGAYFMGVRGGAILGFFFGLTSLLNGLLIKPDAIAAIVFGTNTGFGFYNVVLILCVLFVPRVLTGVFSALVYRALSAFDKTKIGAMSIAALTGSLTNTVLLLGALYVLAFEQTATAFGVTGEALMGAILSVVTLNGLLEAAVAAVICPAVGKALQATADITHK